MTQDRLERAKMALDGLSVADALGGFFEFARPQRLAHFVQTRPVPDVVWHWTDDTNMALSIYQNLRQHGRIDQDSLAVSFAEHYEPPRGYGMGARRLLKHIRQGGAWRELASAMFGGTGSFGNGGAMRVAPIGAYFADDLTAVVENARLSAAVTHTHPEGIAGAIAVAVGVAFAWRLRGETPSRRDFIDLILPHIPDGQVKDGCVQARDLSFSSFQNVVEVLGNGSRVSAQDTVPFVMWSAGERLSDYMGAFWQTAQAGGDVDTTCAMVGAIVACHGGEIPAEWLDHREPLPAWALQE